MLNQNKLKFHLGKKNRAGRENNIGWISMGKHNNFNVHMFGKLGKENK